MADKAEMKVTQTLTAIVLVATAAYGAFDLSKRGIRRVASLTRRTKTTSE